MDTVKLLKCVQTVVHLKQLLKCPICLDVLQDIVELQCGHRYCNKCYEELRSRGKNPQCALCKQPIKRRTTLYKDRYADNLCEFTSCISDEIKRIYKNEAERLNTNDQEMFDNIIKQITEEEGIDVPSSSKTKTPEPNSSEPRTHCEKAFDNLLASSSKSGQPKKTNKDLPVFNFTINKAGSRRTYTGKKKPVKPPDIDILNFDDYKNKKDIIDWLSDTRNKFDRLTQTQNIVDLTEDIPELDLPSVTQTCNKNQVQTKHTKIARTNKELKRAKSLEIEVKNASRVKRHTFGAAVSALDDYAIEEINTEEERIVKEAQRKVQDMLEEECLENYENIATTEGSKKKKDDSFDFISKTGRSLSKKGKLPVSGWDRMKDVQKSIKKGKKGKVPKELTITLSNYKAFQPTTNKKNENVKKGKISGEQGNEDKILGVNFKQPTNKEQNKEGDLPTYNFDEVENYLAKNMTFISKTSNDTTLSTSEINKSKEKIQELEIDAYSLPTQKIVLDKVGTNENTIQADVMVHAAAIDDDIFLLPTQKTDENQEEIANKNEAKTVLEVPHIPAVAEDCETLEEVVKLLEENLNKSIASVSFQDGAQGLVDCYSNINTYCVKIMDLIKCPADKTSKEIQTNFVAVSNVQVQTSCVILSSKEVQTVDSNLHCTKCKENKDANRSQTKKATLNDEDKNNSLLLKNDDLMLTGSFDNINFETQDLRRQFEKNKREQKTVENKENHQSTQNRSGSFRNELPQGKKNLTQDILLDSSFDNVNIDTQEIAKKYEEKSKLHTSKLQTTNVSLKTKNTPDKSTTSSVLVCSLEPTATTSKKISRQLSFGSTETKKFKRIRSFADSDSDDKGNSSKRPCHKFVRDDLSIKFTDTEKQATQAEKKRTDSSFNSENVNYDEYLDEVMKKYNTPHESPIKEKAPDVTEEEDDELKELMNNCDKLIQQAASITDNKPSSIIEIKTKKLPSTPESDNIFLDENNLDQFDKDIEQYEQKKSKTFSSEYSDIISETERVSPVRKKLKIDARSKDKQSESLFASQLLESRHPRSNKEVTQQNISKILEDINRDFETFDDVNVEEELENISTSAEDRKQKENRVKVLQNVILDKQIMENKDESNKGNQVVTVVDDSNGEDDDAFSDVVETTPQKKVENLAEKWSALSQLDGLKTTSNLITIDDAITVSSQEDFELDAPLPPPPGFGDDSQTDKTNDSSSVNVTVIDNDATVKQLNTSSLTPDKLSQYIAKAKENTEVKNSFSNLITSRTSSQAENSAVNIEEYSLPISPIGKPEDNLVEMRANTSKYTPLVTVSKQASRKNIMTSTPKQKSIWNYVKSSPEDKKPCLACTRISKDQVAAISCLSNKKLVTFSNTFGPSVTHMIVAVNEKNCIKDHTVKFVLAVAEGIWIVRAEWVQECLKRNCIVPEEPYEALDVTGVPGPKISRLTRKTNPLFKGYKFFCSPPFSNITKEEVENAIKMLGGEIVAKPFHLLEDHDSVCLIITETTTTQEFEQFEKWLELYKIVTVEVEWLTRSIGQYRVLSVRPYVLCSDDSICDLGYPAHLVETVPFSCSDQI